MSLFQSCLFVYFLIFIFKVILLIVLLQLPLFFSPLYSPPPCTPLQSFPHLSSCPRVIHTSYLASPFPILFLTTPCLFCTYHLCFLFPVPFLPFSPSLSPLITLYMISICDSITVLVVGLVCFYFCFQIQLLIVVSLLSIYCS